MTQISLLDTTRAFKKTTAVNRLSLTIESGEFVTLLGPSGCGKTTTLRLIAGLETPDFGEILFNGVSGKYLSSSNRGIGYVTQSYTLFPHMNVMQNICFAPKMAHKTKEYQEKLLATLIEDLHLHGLEKAYPNELSGGQRQRVAIAQALAGKPKVLLLDEPFSSLDAQLSQELRNLIANLHNRYQLTVVLVTHDQQEAIELSDRIALLFNGELTQFSTPQQLYHHPETMQAAKFMGNANFLECTRISANILKTPIGLLQTNTSIQQEQNFVIARTENENLRPNHYAMIRYEALKLAPLDKARQSQTANYDSPSNTFIAQITSREFLGNLTRYQMIVGEEQLFADTLSTPHLQPGDMVELTIPPHSLWHIIGK